MESVQSVVDEGWKMVMKKKEEVKEGEEEEGEQVEKCCLLKERCDQRRSEWRKKKPKKKLGCGHSKSLRGKNEERSKVSLRLSSSLP